MTASALTSDQLSALVVPRERVYFALIVLLSLGIYALLAFMALGLLAALGTTREGTEGMAVLVYIPVVMVIYFLLHAYAIGRIRGNSVRVTDRQLPAVHRLVTQHSRILGLASAPPVYVMQAGGTLNAFATKFFGRQFVVLFSDVVALAEARGAGALGFVVAHELAHIRRGHLRFRWLTLPGRMMPYLGNAYSRACEYTCDRFASQCEPADAINGLLVLAAGPALYRQVDASLFAEQVDTEGGFWVRRAEIASSHPFLPNRVAALLENGVPKPTMAPNMGG